MINDSKIWTLNMGLVLWFRRAIVIVCISWIFDVGRYG
jgi:hypothetical protein